MEANTENTACGCIDGAVPYEDHCQVCADKSAVVSADKKECKDCTGGQSFDKTTKTCKCPIH